ncbi:MULTISPECIES: hypothetical protein [unclassified Undibacterium]|uniref:hypothetical protein n=1 Tax=unclassified Undibacterium TaxID=2630295 RepID=UPI002AC90A9D|nr:MULTISPECIES: hypothetical protein [unclassified Undibacterium]MEB0214030.1 hypothetical protein [Undibacterium sp. 5I2]WPX43645.1 hypothetical protein RHM61_20140 [Undibacterium sp. CCC3.4]
MSRRKNACDFFFTFQRLPTTASREAAQEIYAKTLENSMTLMTFFKFALQLIYIFFKVQGKP